ncbi:hypothetical protein FB451DRAFT_1180625 [Mycena latifolia]|nr:hypothetical protein FB451DRAFT_1180625 [Mycena latifolia]
MEMQVFKSCSAVSGSGRSPTMLRRLLKFKREHATYDEDYRPPTFRRHDPSRFASTEAISVGSKRTGDQGDEKAVKRVKKTDIAPKKQSGAKAGRRLRIQSQKYLSTYQDKASRSRQRVLGPTSDDATGPQYCTISTKSSVMGHSAR